MENQTQALHHPHISTLNHSQVQHQERQQTRPETRPSIVISFIHARLFPVLTLANVIPLLIFILVLLIIESISLPIPTTKPTPPTPHFETSYNLTVLGSGAATTVLAVPALFGTQLPRDTHTKVALLVLPEEIDGCIPFDVDTPSLTTAQNQLLRSNRGGVKIVHREQSSEDLVARRENLAAKPTRHERWLVMLPRGNCPFDIKVLHAQIAGFAGVVVYNSVTSSDDVPVRMSANNVGDSLAVWAMFVTRKDATLLQRFAFLENAKRKTGEAANSDMMERKKGSRKIGSVVISLETSLSASWISSNTLFTVVPTNNYDLIAVFLLMISATFTVMWFLLIIGGGGIFFVNLHELAPPKAPTLSKVDLPLRTITDDEIRRAKEDDLEQGGNGKCDQNLFAKDGAFVHTINLRVGDCCAICIDEFVVGDRLRQLPCRHQFHDTCIDPWLLQHNRLCPICKRDVLESSIEKSTDFKSPDQAEQSSDLSWSSW
ncbi:hypothetical protein HK096_008082, partial [Nowakowskiella sp. JEL0078]